MLPSLLCYKRLSSPGISSNREVVRKKRLYRDGARRGLTVVNMTLRKLWFPRVRRCYLDRRNDNSSCSTLRAAVVSLNLKADVPTLDRHPRE
jgi:hypothetical protein